MSRFNLADTTRDVFQGFFPCSLYEYAIAPNEWVSQAIRIAGGMEPEKSPSAQVPIVSSRPMRRIHFYQFLALCLDGNLTAVSTVSANALGSFQHPGPIFIHGQPAGNRSDRANLHAAAAELAIQRVLAEGLDFGHRAATDRRQRFDVHHFIAVSNAAETLHAAIHLGLDERTEILLLEDAFGFDEPAGRCVLVGKVLKVALSSLIADRTIERMVGKDELEHRSMGIVDDGRGGAHAHPFVDRRAAGRLKFGHLFDFDQAHAAIGVRFELRVIAEMRNHDADTAGRFDY
jgi:hypothetical protein